MNLKQIAQAAYETSRQNGFWPGNEGTEQFIPEKLCLIHSEVSEALECWRDNDLDLTRLAGKPVGFPSELADIIIRTCDLAAAYGIDIEKAVIEKLEYNKSRPYRHGGKRG